MIVRRQLKRRYVLTFFQKLSPCLVGIEACGSAHHWSRELQALGHTVRLMPPAYVKPYVKRQKTASLGEKLPKLHSPNTSIDGNICRRNAKRGGHNGGAGKSEWLPRGLAN